MENSFRGGRLNFTSVLILKMAIIFGKYVLYCNGIDPFVLLMGNLNWRPISCNNIASNLYCL